jgi:hypothetical protein
MPAAILLPEKIANGCYLQVRSSIRAPIRYRPALIAILTAGFLLRIAAAVAIPARPVSDFWEYFSTSQSLAASGRYEAVPGVPIGGHPPAYPILLSAAFRAVPADWDLATAKILNALLALGTALAGAALARRLWGDAAGLGTAAWLSFLPRSLLMSDLVASENLFEPLLLLFLLLAAISWTRSASFALAATIGAVAGLLTLTRSVGYLLPVVWLFGALLARRPWRRVAGELLLVLAVEHAVLMPWGLRNSRTLGRFTLFNDVGGVGLFIGNNEHATGEWYDWSADLERLRPGVFARGPVAVDDAAREEARRWIRAHPAAALRLYANKLYIVLKDDCISAAFAIYAEGIRPPDPPADALPGPHVLKEHRRVVCGVLRLSGLLLAAAALAGLLILLLGKGRSTTDRLLAAGILATALYVPVLSSAIAVNGRYRWPAEDAVAPLAGLALAGLTGRRAALGPTGSSR